MKRLGRQLKSYRSQFVAVIRNEFRAIFTDEGALLILVFALFIYSTTYSLAYGPQVLRNVPIGVVDNSHTVASRRLTATFDAGPNAYVAYEPTDMEQARELFFQRRIYGIVYIPENYERRLLEGEQADVAIYVDASYFLMYRQVFQELVSTIGLTGATVGLQRLIARGTELPQAEATVQPVVYQSHNLFNPYLGYGSFAMPAIIIVIIQQTLLIGIGMIGGTWRERGLYRKLCQVDRRRMLPAAMSGRPATDVDFADYCWAGFDLSVDLRGDGLLYSRRALQVVSLSGQWYDGSRRGFYGGLSFGGHRSQSGCFDVVPYTRKFAVAVALDIHSGIDVERCLVSA